MANHDHYTVLAIRSIFLGARIHDAAIICGRTDRAMRDEFLMFCKKNNRQRYSEILIISAHDGYTTPPVSYFRERILDFIPMQSLYPSFMADSLEEMGQVSDYLDRCLGAASAHLSILRARRDSWDGLMSLRRAEQLCSELIV